MDILILASFHIEEVKIYIYKKKFKGLNFLYEILKISIASNQPGKV